MQLEARIAPGGFSVGGQGINLLGPGGGG